MSSPYLDRLEPVGETIPFEGIVTQISDDGKVRRFRLTKPINPENEATQKARKEGVLIDVGDTIIVNDSPEWHIRPIAD